MLARMWSKLNPHRPLVGVQNYTFKKHFKKQIVSFLESQTCTISHHHECIPKHCDKQKAKHKRVFSTTVISTTFRSSIKGKNYGISGIF